MPLLGKKLSPFGRAVMEIFNFSFLVALLFGRDLQNHLFLVPVPVLVEISLGDSHP